jgi:hypothetical protein
MEISTAVTSMSPVPGSCAVNISVEFGDELVIISVLVPDEVSDEQKKVLAIGRAKSLARKFGNLP